MSSDRHRSPRVGDRIAPHLTLSAILGHGGMATVFEALHARLRAPVAVKVPMVSGAHAHEAEHRLLSEARLCARLDDPRFARIYDIAELADGRPYFVMEKVTGPTLDAYLERHRLNVSAAARIVRELLGALQVIHGRGIVHRDVKPANVILQTYRGALTGVRLLDFGVARDAALPAAGAAPGPIHTLHGEVLGTPGYMPPEQIRSDRVDARADLFAVGVTFHQMLTGQLPFDETQAVRRMQRTLNERIPDVREQRPECPAALADWLATATATEPEHRFESAEAALLALEEVRGALRTTRELGGPVPHVARAWRPRPANGRAGSRLLAAAAAALVWLVASPLSPSQRHAHSTDQPAGAGRTASAMAASEGSPAAAADSPALVPIPAGLPLVDAAKAPSADDPTEADMQPTRVRLRSGMEAGGSAQADVGATPVSVVEMEPIGYPVAPLDGLDKDEPEYPRAP